MNNKQQGILKKAAALILALLLMLAAVSASIAASEDWTELVITLSWTDANGETQSVTAVPQAETETGEGCFWAMVPAETLPNGLIFTAMHPMHEYEFFPASGTQLEGIMDAGEVMDGLTCLPISAIENETTEVFYLYISTVTDTPVIQAEEPGQEPEPVQEPETDGAEQADDAGEGSR